MPRKEVIFEGYDDVAKAFLSSQKLGTAHTYKSYLRYACKFFNMTATEMLESKKNDKDFLWERKIIDFKNWLRNEAPTTRGKNGLSDNAARIGVNTVRSFFDYYRAPLKFSQQERRKVAGKCRREKQDYPLSNDDLAKMSLVGDLREKYIVLVGKSFGLRAGDFATLTYGTFRRLNIDDEPPIPIGEVETKKEGITAYPFLDNDAIPIIKALIEANKDKTDSEKVITIGDEQLSGILQNLAAKAGINLYGKHLRFHCLRKYLIDRLSINTSESKWKQIVGKAISEDAYVSPLELKDAYAKCMKLTTINGNGKVTKLSEQIQRLQEELARNRQDMKEIESKLSERIAKKEEIIAYLSIMLEPIWKEENELLKKHRTDLENPKSPIHVLTEEEEQKYFEWFDKEMEKRVREQQDQDSEE